MNVDNQNGARKAVGERADATEQRTGHDSAPSFASSQITRHPMLLLFLLTVSELLIVLDFSIVQIALPSIQREFGLSVADLQWVVTAYGLTLAGFLLLSGRAGDLYGHKRIFIVGLLVSSITAFSASAAPSVGVLIAARAIQGVGAAMGLSAGLSILVMTFPEGPERNRALGIFAAVLGSGFVMGVISGGIITSFFGWRWVFGVTVPIGFAAAGLSSKFIPGSLGASSQGRKVRLDFGGTISITVGLILLVYALTVVGSIQSIIIFSLSGLSLAAFVLIERRTREPLLPLGFLRRRSILMANILGLTGVASFVGGIFILTLYLQQVLGYSALETGLTFAPSGFAFFAVSGFVSPKLVNRFGLRSVLVGGEALAIAGYILLSLISPNTGLLGVVIPEAVAAGVGFGLLFPAFNIAALMGANRGEEGLAAGVSNTFRQIGTPIGIAIMTTIASVLGDSAPGASAGQMAAMLRGFDFAFLGAAVLAFIALLFASAFKTEVARRILVAPKPIAESPTKLILAEAQ